MNEDEHHSFVRVDVERTKSVNETVSLWAVLTLIFSCNHRYIIIKLVILPNSHHVNIFDYSNISWCFEFFWCTRTV